MSELLDGPDFNHYTFQLHHTGSPRPLRTKVIRTRKGIDQARAELPAVTAEYRWELAALSGPTARHFD
jgi:hypothetical protein